MTEMNYWTFFATKVTYKTQEERDIVINTILYPEDIRILDELTYFETEEKLSHKLNIPVEIIRLKSKEFTNYKIWNLLQKNEDARKVAIELSNIDTDYGEEIINRIK